jgi:DNA-binding response OmpR family regulator
MRRMMIVEDELDLCQCLADFFEMKGFSIVSAFSGEEAIKKLEEGPVDVLLLDILLPGVSGMEVLRRAKELHPTALAVMVTALDQVELRDEARRQGAVAYVTKPFDFSPTTWAPILLAPVPPPDQALGPTTEPPPPNPLPSA